MGRSWLCPPAAALTVARNWASSSSKLAVYNSFTMHIYSRKVYKKLLITLISQETKERGLLPLTQMGVRPKRSTLSALELIDETVRTA